MLGNYFSPCSKLDNEMDKLASANAWVWRNLQILGDVKGWVGTLKTVVFIPHLFLHQIHAHAHSSYICQLKSLENERCLPFQVSNMLYQIQEALPPTKAKIL